LKAGQKFYRPKIFCDTKFSDIEFSYNTKIFHPLSTSTNLFKTTPVHKVSWTRWCERVLTLTQTLRERYANVTRTFCRCFADFPRHYVDILWTFCQQRICIYSVNVTRTLREHCADVIRTLYWYFYWAFTIFSYIYSITNLFLLYFVVIKCLSYTYCTYLLLYVTQMLHRCCVDILQSFTCVSILISLLTFFYYIL